MIYSYEIPEEALKTKGMTLISFGAIGQQIRDDDVWIRIADSTTGTFGYRDEKGKIATPAGKSPVCFTEAFLSYAVVLETRKGIVKIDRRGHIAYDVFIFDNGPADRPKAFSGSLPADRSATPIRHPAR